MIRSTHNVSNSHSKMRRQQDVPILVVSQDYELFFGRSGSIDKCLIEPCELLLDFAEKSGVKITFFVDAGMLCRMEALAANNASIERDLARTRRHIATLVAQGHEIGLHIHPHWEDTRWVDGAWDFQGTRYRLSEFSDADVTDIVRRYAGVLQNLANGAVRSYRAGGFCIEPFSQIRSELKQQGITIDSSVIPGARLKDADKGFDFAGVPDSSWWRFSESPLQPDEAGDFLEIAITPLTLPLFHYWGRAFDRVLGRRAAGVSGDGVSKAIGRREIARRLAGAGRVSELSIDAAKAGQLRSRRVERQNRDIWQVMGHPKLLGGTSLRALEAFIARRQFRRFETLSGLASAIGGGELGEA